MAVAGFAVLLLDRGVSSHDTLVLLGEVSILTLALTAPAGAYRQVLRLLRGSSLMWALPYSGQNGATA